MNMRWRILLPIIGVIAFGAISYSSYRTGRERHQIPSRYFKWSTLPLDSTPLREQSLSDCVASGVPCLAWEQEPTIMSPTVFERLFILSALPAVAACLTLTFVLGKIGVNEILSFMVSMPFLTAAWFYLVGRLLDRRRSRRINLVGNA
jgi:hypothetical protein